MNYSFKKAQFADLKTQHRLALGVCGVLALSNICLVIGLMSQEARWILIPQFNPDHRVEITQQTYSEAYLREWAGDILRDVLTANPSSIDAKINRLLSITRSSYTDLKDKLLSQAKVLKDNGLSSVFYPKEYRVFPSKNLIEVRGDYLSFFGHDRKPVAKTKTFELGYERGPHGVILLTSLEEKADA